MRIDVHAHTIPEEFLRWIEAHPDRAQAEFVASPGASGGRRLVYKPGFSHAVPEGFWNLEVRREQMAAGGVDAMVLSPAPPIFYYWAEPQLGIEVARRINDGIAKMVAEDPGHLWGMATLPMASPEAAAVELRRAVQELGLRGALISTEIEGVGPADPRFALMWEAADALGAVVNLHPYLVGDPGRLAGYYLGNLLGNPWGTTVAATELILSGLLDRYPRVQVVLAHAGGFMPYGVGRLNHGYEVRPETPVHARQRPEDYLRRFHYDTIAFHPKALAFLMEMVGADRVMLGSDYPFDMAEWPPSRILDGVVPEGDPRRDAVESDNAIRLFGLA